VDIKLQVSAISDPSLREKVMVTRLRKSIETIPIVLALTVLFPAGQVFAAEKKDTTKAVQALAVREATILKNLDLTRYLNTLATVSTKSAEPRIGNYVDLSSEIDHSIETRLAKFFETSHRPEALPRRGAKEAILYREVSPGVVLIISGEDTLGSGSIISKDGLVLTNWHVVKGIKKVVVVFKPPRGSEIREQDVFIGIVVKIDEIADLALVKILTPPANMIVLKFGKMNKIEVGIDATTQRKVKPRRSGALGYVLLLPYGRDSMISRYSCSVKPLRVVVRTLPAEPRARANRATASSFGASTLAMASHWPSVMWKLRNLTPQSLASRFAARRRFGEAFMSLIPCSVQFARMKYVDMGTSLCGREPTDSHAYQTE